MKLLSVIIPSYNGARYLSQTIESVLAQTVSEWELVVVDDGSTDATPSVVRAYAARDSRIRLIRQANRGIASARNRGMVEADRAADFMVFLDHDDVWEPNALELLLSALRAQPEAAAANGLSRIIDEAGRRRQPGELEVWGRRREGVIGNRIVRWLHEEASTLAVLAVRNYIYTPGQALIRRGALEAAGPFDAAMSPCDDWDMWLRLSRLGGIAYLDRVVLNWRAHASNASADRARLFEHERRVRDKLASLPDLCDSERRTVRIANGQWCRQVRSQWLRSARALLAHGRVVRAMGLLRLAMVV